MPGIILDRRSDLRDVSENLPRFSNLQNFNSSIEQSRFSDVQHDIEASTTQPRFSNVQYVDERLVDPARFSDHQQFDSETRSAPRFSSDANIDLVFVDELRITESQSFFHNGDDFDPGTWPLSGRRRPSPATSGASSSQPLEPFSTNIATIELTPPFYVRALYDYDADIRNCLSFRKDDIILVYSMLASGWWDGAINDVRGWFPSNYTVPSSANNLIEETGASEDHGDGGSDIEGESHEDLSDEDLHETYNSGQLQDSAEAVFWVPQATPDGRLFYFNTLTGRRMRSLPPESYRSQSEVH